MENIFLLISLFIIPIFGKAIDFKESLIFYSLPSILIFYTILIKKESLKLRNKPLIFILILISLFVISTLLSINPGGSYYFLFIFINCLLMTLVVINNISPKQFERGLLISLIIFSIIFLLNRLNIINLNPSVLNDNFIDQKYGHSYLADLLVLIFPFLISKVNPELNKKQKYLNYFYFIFFLTTLILTNSRSSVVALTIGLFFLKAKNFHQKTIKNIIIGLMSIALIISLTPQYQNKFNKTIDGERFKYWNVAIQSFKRSPLFGNGPNTFPLIRKEIQDQSISGNLAHNSFLSFLCENGIIFTILLFITIIYGLRNNQKKNNTFFGCSIIAITHSFLDPTWSSPGIFIISLYLIFYYSPIFINTPPKKILFSPSIITISSICFLFFVMDSISNHLLFQDKYQNSLIFNPLNLDSRLKIISTTNPNLTLWQKNLQFTLKYFSKNEIVYQTLTNTLPFLQSEKYYYQLINLNPKESFSSYFLLTDTYSRSNNFNKLEQILNLIDQNFIENQIPSSYAIPLSKISYNYAIDIYPTNKDKAIKYLKLTNKLFPLDGFYRVELANALWSNNKKEDAIKQLSSKCQEYPSAKEQCQTYLKAHQYQEFNQPGSLESITYVNEKLK
jgi:O-antigen ligase